MFVFLELLQGVKQQYCSMPLCCFGFNAGVFVQVAHCAVFDLTIEVKIASFSLRSSFKSGGKEHGSSTFIFC